MTQVAQRERIDIEALIVRAYWEKQVDRLGLGDERSERALSRMVAMSAPSCGGGFNVSERVDTSPYAAKMAAREREFMARIRLVTDDLLMLHDAVLSLPDFYLERFAGLDFVVWDADTARRMGHRIDVCPTKGARITKLRPRGGNGADAAEMVPDGEPRRVTAIVTTSLVIRHGRGVDRPDVPDLVVTGYRPRYEGATKQAVGHDPVYETPLDTVVEARATYAVWHAALGMLAAACASGADHDVSGPVAPAEPWTLASPLVLPSLVKPAVAAKRVRPYKPRPNKKKLAQATV